jgi:hypothetical protein
MLLHISPATPASPVAQIDFFLEDLINLGHPTNNVIWSKISILLRPIAFICMFPGFVEY